MLRGDTEIRCLPLFYGKAGESRFMAGAGKGEEIMIKITLKIGGMMCGMCESHINDAVRSSFAVKKVTSSHRKGKTEIITEIPIAEDALKKVIDATGYTLLGIQTEGYERKGFSLFERKGGQREK